MNHNVSHFVLLLFFFVPLFFLEGEEKRRDNRIAVQKILLHSILYTQYFLFQTIELKFNLSKAFIMSNKIQTVPMLCLASIHLLIKNFPSIYIYIYTYIYIFLSIIICISFKSFSIHVLINSNIYNLLILLTKSDLSCYILKSFKKCIYQHPLYNYQSFYYFL